MRQERGERKINEEATEVILASKCEPRERLVSESAELPFPLYSAAKRMLRCETLIHGYYDVDVAVVAQTIRGDFPVLIRALIEALSYE